MKAADWIDLVKSYRQWASDYRVAKELGLSRNTVSMYRSKTPTMDEETAVAVAQALDRDPGEVVLDQIAERTKNPVVREALQEHLLQPGDVYPEGVTQQEMERLSEEPVRRPGGSGSKSRLDITSVTQASAAGELCAPRSKRYASYPSRMGVSHAPALQLLQRAFAAMLSYRPPLGAA